MAKKKVEVFERNGDWWGRTEDNDEFPLNSEQKAQIQLQMPKERIPRAAMAAESVLTKLPGEKPTGEIEHDVPGATMFRRFAVKNAITDPELAKRYLSQWYDIKPYGNGFNFLLRPIGREDIPWRPLDPEPSAFADKPSSKESIDERMNDLLDLTSDGVFMAAMARGGPVGTGAAGFLRRSAAQALMASGVEAARELSGVPLVGAENISPTQIGAVGAASLVGDVVSKGGQMLFDKTRKALLGLGAGVIGIKRTATRFAPGQVLSERGQIPGFKALKSFEDGVNEIRAAVAEVGDANLRPFPESVAADKIVTAADNAGVKVSLRSTIDHLSARTKAPKQVPAIKLAGRVVREAGERLAPTSKEGAGEIVRESALPAIARKKLNELYDLAVEEGIDDLDAVPPSFALKAVRHLQNAAEQRGGFGAKIGEAGKQSRNALSTASGLANEELKKSLDVMGVGPDGLTYRQLMEIIAPKTKLVKYWKSHMFNGKDEFTQKNNALAFIRSAYNDTKGGILDAANDFDRTFGTNIANSIKEPIIGELFGDLGEAGLKPRLTATGGILGAGMVGGGLFTGGIPGGGAGLLIGAGAASPASILAATKFGQQAVYPIAQRLIATDPVARAGLVTAINEKVRRMQAEEKERKNAQKP